MPSFSDNFLRGAQAGQQLLLNRAAEDRAKALLELQKEDRETQKQVLQHRLRELKLQERLQAREAAIQNLNLLQGTPESDITPGMTEGGVLPSRPRPGAPINTPLSPVEIPGIEELGVSGISRRPQTMEQILAQQIAQKRLEALTTPYNLSAPEGGVARRFLGNEVIGEVQGPESLVPFTQRDASGRETTTWIPESERAKLTAVREPVPLRISTPPTPQEDISVIADEIRAGRRSPDLTGYRGQDRIRIDTALGRTGYNTRQAMADERALRTFYNTLNSGSRADLRIAADAAESALDELVRANEAWKGGQYGVLNPAALAAAKRGIMGQDAQRAAVDLETAVEDARNAIARVASGGSITTNRALDSAATLLSGGMTRTRLDQAINQLRKSLQYRVNAIRNVEPILPSDLPSFGQGGQGGQGATGQGTQGTGPGRFIYDPDTGSLIPVQ